MSEQSTDNIRPPDYKPLDLRRKDPHARGFRIRPSEYRPEVYTATLADGPITKMTLEQWNASRNSCGPLIDELLDTVGQYMSLEDPGAFIFALAVVTSAAIDDDEPLWGMEVGASSGGKAEAIRVVQDVADKSVDEITVAGLLSGRPPTAKERTLGVTKTVQKGLLQALQGRRDGVITISDMSPLLGRNAGHASGDDTKNVFDALRPIYDGSYTRIMNQVDLHWEGRITLLAGVTPAIDKFSSHADALGPRYVYYRLKTKTDAQRRDVIQRVNSRGDVDNLRARAREIAAHIVRDARNRVNATTADTDTLSPWVMTACAGRTSVSRDYQNQIDELPDTEDPGRVTCQLGKLLRSLRAMGIGDALSQNLTRHAALSCIPKKRSAVLWTLRSGDYQSTLDVSESSHMSLKVTRTALGDLAAVGLVDELIAPNYGVPSEGKPDTRPVIGGEILSVPGRYSRRCRLIRKWTLPIPHLS